MRVKYYLTARERAGGRLVRWDIQEHADCWAVGVRWRLALSGTFWRQFGRSADGCCRGCARVRVCTRRPLRDVKLAAVRRAVQV